MDIMSLLDGVVLGIQASHWEPLQYVAVHTFLVMLAREITSHSPWE